MTKRNCEHSVLKEISNKDEIISFMEGAIGILEANSFETMMLWEKYKDRPEGWKEHLSGFLITVGTFAGHPVCFALNYATVANSKILIIEDTSNVVNHEMIEEWLLKNAPMTCRQQGKDRQQYLNKQNTMNFHNLLPR